MLRYWSGGKDEDIEPRTALQLVHEAALCVTGKRENRTLSQKGFEVANGLPFVVSDPAVHDLLDAYTVREAEALQLMLGKIRETMGHFPGRILAVDPHRIQSYSKRQMVRRKKDPKSPATKQLQTFFLLDADSQQPLCFTVGSSSRTVSQATPPLLDMAAEIIRPGKHRPLVLADTEHFTQDLLEYARKQSPFDLLVPMPMRKEIVKELNAIPAEAFTRHWIGYATAERPWQFKSSKSDPYLQIVQHLGAEQGGNYERNAFLCTAQHAEVDEPVQHFPKRWHCEEFFNSSQALGWNRAGTNNLNIRYGQMSMALIAQTILYMLRQRIGHPFNEWDAAHLSKDFLQALEGDVRIHHDTIIVTYYNAPNADALRKKYQHLPRKLEEEGVNPKIPWLYNYKIDFRFK